MVHNGLDEVKDRRKKDSFPIQIMLIINPQDYSYALVIVEITCFAGS